MNDQEFIARLCVRIGIFMEDASGDPILSTVVVRPEQNSTWESGFKTSVFDRAVTFNIDAYYTRVRDFQANLIDNAAVIALRSYLANIPLVTVKGVEFDASARIGSRFTLRASGSYAAGRYASYPAGPCPIELIGFRNSAVRPYWQRPARPPQVVGIDRRRIHYPRPSERGVHPYPCLRSIYPC